MCVEDVLTQFPFTKRVPFSPLPLSHHHPSLATTRKRDIIRISSEKDENVGSRPFRSDMNNRTVVLTIFKSAHRLCTFH